MMPNNNLSKQTTQNKKSSGSGYFLIGLISFVAIFLAGGGIGLGYYAWLELNKRFDQATVDRQAISHEIATIDENSRLQNFKKQIQLDIETFDQKLIALSNQIEQQAALQEEISESAQEMIAYVNRSQLSWGLKETEHVLRMANHRLHIEGDVNGTIAAMNAADMRLKELDDSRLLPVRESISNQVGKLKNFPRPDWVGISLQIDNTISGLRHNLIKETQLQKETKSSSNEIIEDNSELSWWGKFINNIKNSINKSVKVTHEEQRMKLFISQQEKQRIYEFLRMKLLGAKYAVASKDDESYHRELEAALAWIENTDSITNSHQLINELNELNTLDLEPELPDITEPYVLLGNIINEIENS